MSCILRSPLQDARQRVLAYKLSRPGAPATLGALASLVAACGAGRPSPPGGAPLLVLEAPAGAPVPPQLPGLDPARTAVSLDAHELSSPAALEAATALRQAGHGLLLRVGPGPVPAPAVLALATMLQFDWPCTAEAHALLQAWPAGAAKPRLVAAGLASLHELRESAGLELDALVGDLYTRPEVPPGGAPLAPQGVLILQLMQMVQSNADVRHLEAALRRDPVLAWRLLRHLNTASFGLGVEVQSLRHAVAMMGYGPLFRWLAVLLAQSNAQATPPALMQAAVVRGRFTELLGQGLLSRQEAENLFVTGMFSVLDRLLGVPIASVLDEVQLAPPVVQALMHREGIYGPLLRVAEACERPDGHAGELAEAAFLTCEHVDRAHLAALDWALDIRA